MMVWSWTLVTGVPGITDGGTTNRERKQRFRCNFYNGLLQINNIQAVVVNEDGGNFEVTTEEQTQRNQRNKLWGLIVFHHASPGYVPFPLRHACEFIGKVFLPST
jgi:thioredoxin reductase